MMGEHGEQSIQSNLESYTNLDNVLNQFEKRKSTIFERESEIEETKKVTQIKEIESKQIFVNKKSLQEKIQKEDLFLKTKGGKLADQQIWNKDRKSLFENKEDLLERALKEEKESRKNPLKLLEVYIKRIQRLCNKLLQVSLTPVGRQKTDQELDKQVDFIKISDFDFHCNFVPR